MSEITIYVKDGCPYCAAARKHHKEQGDTITEINVPRTPGAKDELLKLTGGESIVPVIVDNAGVVTKGFGGS